MKINPSQIAKAMEVYKAQKPSAISLRGMMDSAKMSWFCQAKAQAFNWL